MTTREVRAFIKQFQPPESIDDTVNGLLSDIKKASNKLNDAVPATLTWGILTAFSRYMEKNKNESFRLKKAFPLFHRDGKPMKDAKGIG